MRPREWSSLALAGTLAFLWLLSGQVWAAEMVHLTPAQRANAHIETLMLDDSGALSASGLTLTGHIEPGSAGRALLTAPAAGRVIEVRAMPGRPLKRGDVLMVLAGPEIAVLQRSAREAQAAAKAAEQRVTRDRTLLKAGVISAGRLEQSEADYAAAAAQRSASIGAYPGMDLSTRDGQMIVRAPVDGVLAGPKLAVGQSVATGDPLGVIGTPEQLHVALVASADVARSLRPGDSATVRGRSCEASAMLSSVGMQVESNHVVTVTAIITDKDTCLLPGESVNAAISPRTAATGSFAVPARAFVRRGSETFVFAERDGGFEVVLVDPEAARAGFARSDVLNRGDRVAITGTALLKGAWIGIADE